jgi:lipooligosaccharide transport system permease protein
MTSLTAPVSNALSIWRLPSLSLRFWPVLQRNLLVWRKLFWPSLLGNTADPLISLVAFGYGLGALVGTVQWQAGAGAQAVAMPYLVFIASGYMCTSAMNAASFEILYSGYSRMAVQKTWDGIMNAPITLDDVVFAELLWATFKALFTSLAMLCVMSALGIVKHPHVLLALPIVALVAFCFSAMGLIFTALAKGYDFFTYYFTLFLTPMMFTSGVFFPRDQLPPWMQTLTDFLPLAAAVELVRPLFMGQWPVTPGRHLAVLLVFGALALWVGLALVRKRFKA